MKVLTYAEILNAQETLLQAEYNQQQLKHKDPAGR